MEREGKTVREGTQVPMSHTARDETQVPVRRSHLDEEEYQEKRKTFQHPGRSAMALV